MRAPTPQHAARPARHLRAEDVMPAPATRPLWRTILVVIGTIIVTPFVLLIFLASSDRSR